MRLICVRLQGLLAEADSIVNNGQWDQLNTVLDRVQNQPNNMKANLKGATAGKASLVLLVHKLQLSSKSAKQIM